MANSTKKLGKTPLKKNKTVAKKTKSSTKPALSVAKPAIKSAERIAASVPKTPAKLTKSSRAAEKPTQLAIKKIAATAKPLKSKTKLPATETSTHKQPLEKEHSKAFTSPASYQATLPVHNNPELNQGKKETMATKAALTGTDSGISMEDGRYALSSTIHVDLPQGYKPSASEEYMNPKHLEYFRRKLTKWREDLVEESKLTIDHLRDEVRDVGDEAERATRETENSLELRTRDRYRKLISKIDKALKRIEEGQYGYCEETDEEIGLDRLEARPIATMTLDAQERWEHRQKQIGE